MPKYLSIEELIALIEEPNRSLCLRILRENRELFQRVHGSSTKHQTWPGGYIDHVTDVMNIAVVQYALDDSLRSLPFRLADALLVLFLHDLEKPWKYVVENDNLVIRPELRNKEAQRDFREQLIADYGIVLTPAQLNALRYVEGEYTDYSPYKRVMNELAAFCHICDVKSARIWYDYPLDEGDPWATDGRTRL